MVTGSDSEICVRRNTGLSGDVLLLPRGQVLLLEAVTWLLNSSVKWCRTSVDDARFVQLPDHGPGEGSLPEIG